MSRGRADLDRLLVQVSPSTYRDQGRVKRDIQTCLATFGNLAPSVETHWNIDGSSVNVILLKGTVPMNYSGQNYHIPVEIFLMVNYPSSAPQVYVKPTADMQIAAQHRHVDKSGLVFMQYLQGWMSNYNLNDLCRELTRMFSESPPVYARTKNPTPQVQPVVSSNPPSSYNYSNTNSYTPRNNNYNTSGSSYNPQNNNYNTYNSASSYNNATTSTSSGYTSNNYRNTSQYSYNSTTPSTNNGTNQTQNKEEIKRRLTSKLQTQINHLQDRIRSELSEELLKQVKLERNTATIKKNIEEMEELKKELNDSIEMLKQRKQDVENWCSEQKDKDETPVSEMIVPLDMYSKQMVDLVANKIAIEDALYSLDRAFENNKIDMTDFMKEVRKLAKDEFMIVALKNKVIQSNASLSPKPSFTSEYSQPQQFTNGFSSGAPGSILSYNVPPPSYNTSTIKYP